MKIKESLRIKILAVCLGCCILAVLLQTVFFQMSSSKIIYEQAKEDSFHSMENMQGEIYSFISQLEYNMNKIYEYGDVTGDMKAGVPALELKKKYYRQVRDFSESAFASSDKVMSLYLYTADHDLISVYRKADTPKHQYPLDIYEDAEKYNSQIVRDYVDSQEKKLFISGYYNESRGRELVRFVLKLYQNSNFKDKIGYLVVDIDSKALINIMNKYTTNKETVIWLQPEGDMAVARIGEYAGEDGSTYKKITTTIAALNPTNADIQERVASEDQGKEFFQIVQKKYNLNAYALMPRYILQENQRVLKKNLMLIVGLIVAFAIFTTIYLSRILTKPLEQMLATIERIKNGETSLRVSLSNNDEIGQLGTSFNEMLDRIEQLAKKEYEAKLLLHQAEYKALQAQINPHFLYNTLDTMSSIAEIKNCSEVSRMSQSLSSIFRYSLDMKNPLSTISREIAHLKNYSFVMSTRMQDNIQYQFDIEDSILHEQIPRISIQPLVENAINHGLRNVRGEKKIILEALKKEDIIYIAVTDNGVGMDPTELNRSLEANSIDYVEKGSSIGLHNINARLKMLYGSRYGIRVESEPGNGTKVYMEIPCGNNIEKMDGTSDHV